MTTIEIVLAVLKLINLIMNYVDREQMKQAGRDEVLADIAQQIAVKTGVRKVILEKVDAMSEEQVNQALRDLVTPAAGRPKTV